MLFFEHKRLYGVVGDVDGELVPLGVARIAREGTDVTIVSAMKGVEDALAAAEMLSADGITAEVIDLRTLRPLDIPTVLASVAKTNRIAVVEEGLLTGGWAGEVLARVTEEGLGDLDDAWRIATAESPVPYSPPLEDAFLPGADRIAFEVRATPLTPRPSPTRLAGWVHGAANRYHHQPHRDDGSHRSGAASLNPSVGSHIVVCSSCGRENDADARFCDTCGERLDAQPGEAATRKVVTVVFTDVVGSTALGERLDPESLRHVMWRYFDTMQATLERHGGTVEKFIGDAIVAVFGVPAVHEDDAVRAVRAAFEMREALARVNDDLAREYGVRIATRTGVNTGEVIVGDAPPTRSSSRATRSTWRRDSSRLRGGGVLIGQATYRLVRDAVVVEPASLSVRRARVGRSQHGSCWACVPTCPPFRAPSSRRSSVDAESSPSSVRRSSRRCESSCRLATIVGPPGIGKSRLARQVLHSFESEARIVVGRCVAYGEGITYLPLAEVVKEVAGADPEAGLEALLRTSSVGLSQRASFSARSVRTTSRAHRRRRLGRSGGSSRRSPRRDLSSWWWTTSTGQIRRCSTCSSMSSASRAGRRSCSSVSRVPTSSTSVRRGPRRGPARVSSRSPN